MLSLWLLQNIPFLHFYIYCSKLYLNFFSIVCLPFWSRKTLQTRSRSYSEKIKTLFTGSGRSVKDRGKLFRRPWVRCFPTRTSQPVKNIYVSCIKRKIGKPVSSYKWRYSNHWKIWPSSWQTGGNSVFLCGRQRLQNLLTSSKTFLKFPLHLQLKRFNTSDVLCIRS